MKDLKNYLRRVKRRLFKPQVLKKLKIDGVVSPRMRTDRDIDGLPQVYGIKCPQHLPEVFEKLQIIWKNGLSNLINPGQTVLIKINLNTADPYPASSSPEFLRAFIDFLNKQGINQIMVGDCSSISALPTKKIAKRTGILEAVKGKAEMIYFDQGPWVKVPVGGKYLKQISVPRIAMEVDRIISLANLKTHALADFTMGMKLGVGFSHPLERSFLHSEYLQEKVVEINLAIPSDLTIIDGRTAFISGGPVTGTAVQADIVLLGTDPLAVDVEAYKHLFRLKQVYGCIEHFTADPFAMPQLKHARTIGLGAAPWKGYTVDIV